MRNGLNSENEIKIFILYLMNQINHEIYYDDIANMTYESGYVGYFDFAEIFSKLVDSGDINKTKENFCAITQRGKEIAENLEHLIPPSIKIKGSAEAVRYLDTKKPGVLASYTLEEEAGGYRFKCSITDNKNNKDDKNSTEIFNVSLFVKDKLTADKILETFKENPDSVYRGVYAMLTRNIDFLF